MAEKTFLGAEIGGATAKSQSVPQFCRHRGHYKFTAKRLTYKGFHSTDYVYFTVFSHHKKLAKAKNDILCTKSFGYYEPIGTPEDNELILVR